MRLLIIFSIIFIFLLKDVAAQTLKPGETTFEIIGIIIEPQPQEYDYTGTSQPIAIFGDLSYLNIKWNARYSDGTEKEIGIECYLNCPNPGRDIDINCIDYKISTNYCSHTDLTGGFCTIVNPNYLFENKLNNVTCKFYDPSTPDIKYLPYPNRTFYPVGFQAFTTQNGTITVGQPFILGLNIKSNGLIVTNYTANVSVMPNLQGIVTAYVENPVSSTPKLKYNEIGKLNPKITFLSAGKVNMKILTRSDVDPFTCVDKNYCTSYGSDAECIDNKCWKRNTIEIVAGSASLPDFNWTGVIQIMVLSVAAILIATQRHKTK